MADTEELLDRSGFGETHRTDSWWSHPLTVFVGLSLFVLYATARVVYPLLVPDAPGIEHGSLLSPFFSPLLFALDPGSHHAVFGTFPDWWPRLVRSPAVLILWAPLGLRVTCYYYRKAYYRAFGQDPTACAVGEPRENYRGEAGLLVFQNLHRYFLYLGLLFIVFLSFDAVRALFWGAPAGAPFWAGDLELHLGTVVLAVNAFLLAGYTLGCHSLRYLVGGKMRCFSCPSNPRNRTRADGGERTGRSRTSSARSADGGESSAASRASSDLRSDGVSASEVNGGSSELRSDGGRDRSARPSPISGRYGLWRAVTRLNVNHPTWAWFSLFMVAFADFYVWMVSIGVWSDVILLAP